MCGARAQCTLQHPQNKYFTAVRELYTHAKLKRSSQQACFGLAMNASQPSAVSAPHSQHTAGSQEVEIGYLAALLFEDHDA